MLRNNGLRNDFDKDELRRWFAFDMVCYVCDRRHADCFHHIFGRESNSILNAAPLNNNLCHLYNPNLNRNGTRKKFAQRTFIFLMNQGYILNKNDMEFVEKHID
ncbi:MAG TPA: hypothetical protein PLH82_02130, partial [Candidatus Paceibacterota bacterium]|nr:hypothetical protein [Candidatus Paceibacterota bacterium]